MISCFWQLRALICEIYSESQIVTLRAITSAQEEGKVFLVPSKQWADQLKATLDEKKLQLIHGFRTALWRYSLNSLVFSIQSIQG